MGGGLNGLDAVHLHRGTLPQFIGLCSLPFKGPCDILKSPASGLRNFEEGEDKEGDEEDGKDDENVGS